MMRVNEEADTGGGDGRELSPAQSTSSAAGLEWDPSADVGSHVPANTPVHQSSNNVNHATGDASALDQILVAFSCGFDLGPYVAESRSERFGGAREEGGKLSRSGSDNSSFKTATEETGFDENEHSGNLSTSLSNWQTSGMTRSEIAFSSRRQGSCADGSTRSSSLLWVEVHPVQENESSNVRSSSSGSDSDNQRSTNRSARGSRSGSSSKSIPENTQTRTVKSSVSSETNNKKSQNIAVQTDEHLSSHSHKQLRKRRVTSTSSHHHHCGTTLHGSLCSGHCCHKLHRTHRGSSDAVRHRRSDNSESDALSPCIALQELLENESSQSYAYHALEHHRNAIIHKMRREFQHLEKLNSILLQRRGIHVEPCSVSEPSGSSEIKDHKKIVSTDLSNPSSSYKPTVKHTAGHAGRPQTKVPSKSLQNKQETPPSISELPKRKKPLAFFVPYEPRRFPVESSPWQANSRGTTDNGLSDTFGGKENSTPESSEGEISLLPPDAPLTLQEAFVQHCPEVREHVEKREMLLRKLRMNREISAEVKRDYFRRRNILSPNDSLNQALPPEGPRLMLTKEMRTLTEKKIKKLPEIQDKIIQKRLEDDKRTNRLLSQVFSRKLRQHVLKGDVNINHSKALIRR